VFGHQGLLPLVADLLGLCQVGRLGNLLFGICDHGPRQGRNFFGAEARFDRQQKEGPITIWIAGGSQVSDNGLLLGWTQNFGLLPLYGGTPIASVSLLIR